jgi:hypothetical protein
MNYGQDEQEQWWFYPKSGNRTRAESRTCAHCGLEFVTHRPSAKFCSVACRSRARAKAQVEASCVGCGNPFVVKEAGHRFCSHSCAATKMHAERAVTTHDDSLLVNRDNPRFTKDESGQWWYQTGNAARTRAYIYVCRECRGQYLASIFHKGTKKGFCSRGCASTAWHRANPDRFKRDNSKRWKGGRRRTPKGYVAVHCPGHHSIKFGARLYVLEHRLVMEAHLQRPLKDTERVHHLNGIRDDNRIENLELWENGHPPGQRVHEQVTKHCPTCTCHLKGNET